MALLLHGTSDLSSPSHHHPGLGHSLLPGPGQGPPPSSLPHPLLSSTESKLHCFSIHSTMPPRLQVKPETHLHVPLGPVCWPPSSAGLLPSGCSPLLPHSSLPVTCEPPFRFQLPPQLLWTHRSVSHRLTVRIPADQAGHHELHEVAVVGCVHLVPRVSEPSLVENQ